MNEGLKPIKNDQLKATQTGELRKQIAAGIDSAHAGRVTDGEVLMSQMIGELEAEISAEDNEAPNGL